MPRPAPANGRRKGHHGSVRRSQVAGGEARSKPLGRRIHRKGRRGIEGGHRSLQGRSAVARRSRRREEGRCARRREEGRRARTVPRGPPASPRMFRPWPSRSACRSSVRGDAPQADLAPGARGGAGAPVGGLVQQQLRRAARRSRSWSCRDSSSSMASSGRSRGVAPTTGRWPRGALCRVRPPLAVGGHPRLSRRGQGRVSLVPAPRDVMVLHLSQGIANANEILNHTLSDEWGVKVDGERSRRRRLEQAHRLLQRGRQIR